MRSTDRATPKEDTTVRTTPETSIRELDHRNNGDIDVRLLWNPQTNRASVAVEDERAGQVFQLTVDGSDALEPIGGSAGYCSPLFRGGRPRWKPGTVAGERRWPATSSRTDSINPHLSGIG